MFGGNFSGLSKGLAWTASNPGRTSGSIEFWERGTKNVGAALAKLASLAMACDHSGKFYFLGVHRPFCSFRARQACGKTHGRSDRKLAVAARRKGHALDFPVAGNHSRPACAPRPFRTGGNAPARGGPGCHRGASLGDYSSG